MALFRVVGGPIAVDEAVLLPLTETPVSEAVLAAIHTRLSGARLTGSQQEIQQAFADYYRGHPFISVPRVIASHSACRAFTPGWERNLSDTLIRALAEGGGVIQINFGSSFLRMDVRRSMKAEDEALRRWAAEHGGKRRGKEAGEFLRSYREKHPQLFAGIPDIIRHIDHVVRLVGVDHVGLGSDFDGLDDELPVGLKDVSQYPNLIAGLLRAGYSREDIAKICSGNLLRVWEEVEKAAEGRSSTRQEKP